MTRTSQEFIARLESLGLRPAWLAEHLGLNRRTPERWAAGNTTIPQQAWDALEQLEIEASDQVRLFIDSARPHIPVVVGIETHSDAWPTTWQRAVALRVQQAMPRARILAVHELDDTEAVTPCAP